MLITHQTGRIAAIKEFNGALKITVATNEGYRDRSSDEWVEKVEYLTHTTFREGQINFVKEHAPIGSVVCVNSRPYQTSYEKNGERIYVTDFRIEAFEVVQKASASSSPTRN